MIERHVYFRFDSDHGPQLRKEAAERSRTLAEIPQVRRLQVGVPADEHAEAAWDLTLVLRFDSLDDVRDYVQHPVHRAYVDDYIKPRLSVIKYWNFEVWDSDAG